jgi:hypothetical protein
MTPRRPLAALAVALALAGAPASADEREDLETLRQTTIKLIDLLVEQGVLTREKADQLVKQAQEAGAAEAKKKAQAAAAAGGKPGVVRVPYVPQTVRDEMKEEIRQEVLAQARAERWGEPGALPDWVNRFTFFGDLRLRYQDNLYADGNAFFIDPQATNATRSLQLLNTTEDQALWRIRARLGAYARINDWLTGAVRISTGNLNNPTSANLTQGNYFNRYTIGLDWAYLQADPYDWLTAVGGRFPNPFLHTDLVWATDLALDGAYLKLKPLIGANTRAVFTVGAFPLQEVQLSPDDKWLYAGQAGLQWEGVDARAQIGLAYYSYSNIVGIQNPPGSNQFNYTAPLFLQKGNTLFNISSDPAQPLLALASNYRNWNLTGILDLPAFATNRFVITGDYVRNTGWNAGQASANVGTSVAAETTGWQVRLALGRPELRERNDWLVSMGYKWLQRDAVLDSFADTDFRLGGTNAKGYTLAAAYAFDRNFWLSARWLSADQVSGPPLGIDVLQVDLNARF